MSYGREVCFLLMAVAQVNSCLAFANQADLDPKDQNAEGRDPCQVAWSSNEIAEQDVILWLRKNDRFAVRICDYDTGPQYYLLSPVVRGHFGVCQYIDTALGARDSRTFDLLVTGGSSLQSMRKMVVNPAGCPRQDDAGFVAVGPGISEGLFLDVIRWADATLRASRPLSLALSSSIVSVRADDDRKTLAHDVARGGGRAFRVVSVEATPIGADPEFGPSYELRISGDRNKYAINIDSWRNRWHILRVETVR